MGELLLRAESLLRLVGHYLEPVRLAIFFYHVLRWVIKLPGRAVSAYREVRDVFRFLHEFPQRMVEGFMRAVVVIGLASIAGSALSAVAAKFVRPVVVIGLVAIVGTALFAVAKGRRVENP